MDALAIASTATMIHDHKITKKRGKMAGRVVNGLWTPLLLCLIILHSPDLQIMWMESHQIVLIRPVTKDSKLTEHVVKNTNTLVYGSGGRVYGVIEDPRNVIEEIRRCEEAEVRKRIEEGRKLEGRSFENEKDCIGAICAFIGRVQPKPPGSVVRP